MSRKAIIIIWVANAIALLFLCIAEFLQHTLGMNSSFPLSSIIGFVAGFIALNGLLKASHNAFERAFTSGKVKITTTENGKAIYFIANDCEEKWLVRLYLDGL